METLRLHAWKVCWHLGEHRQKIAIKVNGTGKRCSQIYITDLFVCSF